ncbi:MAG: hypothetical protein AB1486_03480 [Planctomycetota bacterium]
MRLTFVLAAVFGVVLVGLLPALASAQPKGVNDGWQDDGTVVRLKTLTDWVGIGTATPGAKLHVTGGETWLDSEVWIRATSPKLTLQSGEYGTAGFQQHRNTGNFIFAHDVADFVFKGISWYDWDEDWDTAGVEFLRITGNGNVGIGTTTPAWPLEIRHAVPYLASQDTDGGSKWRIGADATIGGLNFAEDGVADARLVLKDGGNVGIGTTNPGATLHLQRDVNAGLNIKSVGESATGIYLGDGAYQDGWRLLQGAGLHGADFMISYPGGPGYLYFTAYGGNVGIGTMTPQAKLDVAGPMQVQGDTYVWGNSQLTGPLTVYGGDVTVFGSLWVYGYKYFVQPHPEDESKEIRFVCLEGPEAGTYFRGSARLEKGSAIIDVPEAFRLASEREGLTVQVTPLGPGRVWVEKKGLDQVIVRGDADVEFDYLVNGVRRGFAGFEPIAEKQAYVPK